MAKRSKYHRVSWAVGVGIGQLKVPVNHVQLFVTLWTIDHQAHLSMEFSRQEYWSGLPFPSPGDLPDPGIEPGSLALQADSLLTEPPGKHWQRRFLKLYF